ncbi:MAG: hypothetical protein KatS3mg048_2493 [Caldilinea sp.]|nr:MAG: hypothetical protein KatS3mg048_2493 [Caldilinea sp.]
MPCHPNPPRLIPVEGWIRMTFFALENPPLHSFQLIGEDLECILLTVHLKPEECVQLNRRSAAVRSLTPIVG